MFAGTVRNLFKTAPKTQHFLLRCLDGHRRLVHRLYIAQRSSSQKTVKDFWKLGTNIAPKYHSNMFAAWEVCAAPQTRHVCWDWSRSKNKKKAIAIPVSAISDSMKVSTISNFFKIILKYRSCD